MKTFTHFFIFAFFSVLTFQSCISDFYAVKGSGKIITKEISISDYNEIEAFGNTEIVYVQTAVREPYLQVNVDDNILPLLDIKVEDNKLVVKSIDNKNLQPTRFKIYTNSIQLEKVNLAGSGEIHLKGEVNSKSLKIDLTGSGDIVADSLFCENFDISVSGSGAAQLKGASNISRFELAGSGEIKAYNFSVQDLTCDIAGSGNVQITVAESLKASIAGSGDLRYYGSPKIVDTDIAGSGKIRKAN